MNTEVMFSAKSPNWGTPLALFIEWDRRWGPFDLDPATDSTNPLGTPSYYTPLEDGLSLDWNGRVFCNPPYGRGIRSWIAKAREEVRAGRSERVVMLLPARTDTKWFHEILNDPHARIYFLAGRIRFVGAASVAPFPSMLVVFESPPPPSRSGA
jgi:site-specific DNA-methyltransferase (adenine-specific)